MIGAECKMPKENGDYTIVSKLKLLRTQLEELDKLSYSVSEILFGPYPVDPSKCEEPVCVIDDLAKMNDICSGIIGTMVQIKDRIN